MDAVHGQFLIVENVWFANMRTHVIWQPPKSEINAMPCARWASRNASTQSRVGVNQTWGPIEWCMSRVETLVSVACSLLNKHSRCGSLIECVLKYMCACASPS